MEFFEVVTTTRAIRRYLPDPIPDADLAQMFFAATRAPSGSNRQPLRFVVLRDGPKALAARKVLGDSFRTMWSDKRAGDAYDRGSGEDPSSRKARTARTMQHFVDHIDEAPVIVFACVQHWHGGHFTEGASVYPACQNLLLSARALGYGAVMTVWHQVVEKELADIVGLPDGVSIAATIPLGRPEGRHGPVRRLPLDQLVYEDGWSESAPWAIDPEGARFSGGPPRGR
ncbi:MAG: nitroreductase family protein [Actinobacteria bacterium]|nr:nitroreductase family protein [Actinomycetota bacterium]